VEQALKDLAMNMAGCLIDGKSRKYVKLTFENFGKYAI